VKEEKGKKTEKETERKRMEEKTAFSQGVLL